MVVVVSDNVVNTGRLEIIREVDNKPGPPIPFPLGSRPTETDGLVFDAAKGTALVSATDSFDDCTGFPGSCTGMAVFDPATQSFGSPLGKACPDVPGWASGGAARYRTRSISRWRSPAGAGALWRGTSCAAGKCSYLSSVELYNSGTQQFTVAGTMTAVRAGHTAMLLADRTVLFIGGTNPGILASAEVYDPVHGTGRTRMPTNAMTTTLR
jgi:hypothetical protein